MKNKLKNKCPKYFKHLINKNTARNVIFSSRKFTVSKKKKFRKQHLSPELFFFIHFQNISDRLTSTYLS